MSSYASDGITYTFTWRAQGDACPECANLNGRSWTGQDIFQGTLYDAFWGDIWNLDDDRSMTHGGSGSQCRCKIDVTVHFDWNKIAEVHDLNELTNLLSSESTEVSGASASKLLKLSLEEATDVGQIEEIRSSIKNVKSEISGLSMNYHQLREMETLLNRTLNLIEQSSGDPNIKKYAQEVSHLITILRMAQMTIHSFEVASGPIGWALALTGFAMTMYNIEATADDIIRGTS